MSHGHDNPVAAAITVSDVSEADTAAVVAYWRERVLSGAQADLCWSAPMTPKLLASMRERHDLAVAKDGAGNVVGVAVWTHDRSLAMTPSEEPVYWRLGRALLGRMRDAGIRTAITRVRAGSFDERRCRRLGATLSPLGTDPVSGEVADYRVAFEIGETLQRLDDLLAAAAEVGR